ncbi:hypothetical protein COD72_10970 [Bacillus cereus]|nr:hypothetical protein COD72_10970 [Bacillus cereus]
MKEASSPFFYKPLLLPFFFIIQFQRLEQSVVSPLPVRQKAPLRQGFQRPPVLNEPPALFKVIQILPLLPFRRRYTLLRYRIVRCGVSFRE